MTARLSTLSDPQRPVNWRWQKAEELSRASNHPFHVEKDLAVRAAVRFWHFWRAARTTSARQLLALRMPILYQAFSIYRDPGHLTRSVWEARLLANEPLESIARKSGTGIPVVRAFTALFFDVMGLLKSPDYILNQAIGPRLRDPLAGWSYDLVWKLFGYLGGPPLLDQLMSATPASGQAATGEALVETLTEEARSALRLQLAVLARTVRVWGKDVDKTLAQLEQLLRAGKGEDQAPLNVVERHVAAMIESLNFTVGADTSGVRPEIAEFDVQAVELRDEELWRLAHGQKQPHLDELKGMTLPPPRNTGQKGTAKPKADRPL